MLLIPYIILGCAIHLVVYGSTFYGIASVLFILGSPVLIVLSIFALVIMICFLIGIFIGIRDWMSKCNRRRKNRQRRY